MVRCHKSRTFCRSLACLVRKARLLDGTEWHWYGTHGTENDLADAGKKTSVGVEGEGGGV